MEPEDVIQLMRNLTVSQIRQQLEKMSADGNPAYDDVAQFFIDASKQEPTAQK